MGNKKSNLWILAILGLFILPAALAMTPVTQMARRFTAAPPLHPDARRDMRTALLALDQAGKLLNDAATATAVGDKEALLKRIRFQLDKAAGDLKTSKAEAVKRGQGDHPDYAAAQTRLAELEKRYGEELTKLDAAQKGARAAVSGIAEAALALKAEYDRLYKPIFSRATGTAIYHHELAEVTAFLAAVEAFEKDDLPKIQGLLEAFAKRVGTTVADEIDRKAEADGWKDTNYRASWAVEKLREGIANVARTRVAMAVDLLARAELHRKSIEGSADFYRVEQYQTVLAYLRHAAKFDAKNEQARSELAGYEAWREADWKAFGRKIDARRFPGPVKGVPGNAAALKKTAIAWFAASLDWGRRDQSTTARDKEPRQVVTVAVAGPWSVQARDRAGRPTMHGLPVKLVVSLASEKHLDVYRVYELTLRTPERAGQQAAPPFDSVTVGNSYYVRPKAVSR